MATIIDSLLIELGLDSSKFDKAQKKSVDELRKFDEANQKTSKNTQRSSKETALGFEKSRDALISFGGAFLGLAGMKEFVTTVTASNASLSRQSNLLGISAEKLQAWGGVAEGFGGSAASLQSTFQNIESSIAKFSMGMGGENVKLGLGYLRLEDKDATDIVKISNALKEFKSAHTIQETKNIADLLGFDTDGYNMLLAGGPALQKLFDEYVKLNHLTPSLSENSEIFQQKTAKLIQSLTGLKNEGLDRLLPSLNNLSSYLTTNIEKFSDWDNSVNGIGTKAIAATGGLLALSGIIKTLGIVFSAASGLIVTSLEVIGVSLSGVLGIILAIPAAVALMAVALNKFGGNGEHKDGEIDPVTGKMWHYQTRKTGKGSEWALQDNPNGNHPTKKWVGGKTRGSGGHWENITSTLSFADLEKQYGLPAGMLSKIMQIESHGNPNAVNPKSGAMGAFQFMPDTAKEYGVTNPFDKNQSATGAAKFLSDLSNHYNGDVDKMLAGYNWGMSNVDKKGMGSLPPETTDYLSKYHTMTGTNATAPMSANNSSSSTIHTTINELNVYSAAQDATGIITDIKKTLQDQALIGYGVGGAI